MEIYHHKNYTLTGQSMILTEEVSRDCGYLIGIPGEERPETDMYGDRREVEKEARRHARELNMTIRVYAEHSTRGQWVVAVVEP